MNSSRQTNQLNKPLNPSNTPSQSNHLSIQNRPDPFSFLKNKENPSNARKFFSHNGLSQDIITVTEAEPDICLEVFYALNDVFWPQIEKLNEKEERGSRGNRLIISLQNAWGNFIGTPSTKGVLCPPEKLIGKKKPKDIIKAFSNKQEEDKLFQDFDTLMKSTFDLKQNIIDYHVQLFQKEEIIKSLGLVEEFYQGYRNQVKALVEDILEKNKRNTSSLTEYDALVDLLEPKAVMMSDAFPHHWAYRISRNKALKLLLLDEQGRPLKSDSKDPASHRVAALPEAKDPLVYFKANGSTAIRPEKEFMLYSLYSHLQIPVPETALLILTDVLEENPEYFYAVQASEAVTGESAEEACRSQEIILDEKAYAEQVIGALLTNPSDGSFQNFKYSPKYKALIGIDNDNVFKSELNGETVNVKSILFLLSRMTLPIPESTKTFYTSLDPHLIIFSWLKDLSQKNREYNLLFSRLVFQKTRCTFQKLSSQSKTPILAKCLEQRIIVDPDLDPTNPFCPQILVSENILSKISEKLKLLGKILLNNPSAKVQDLLKITSPLLGEYYERLRLKYKDPEEALFVLWGKNGFNNSSILSLLSQEEFKKLHQKEDVSNKIVPVVCILIRSPKIGKKVIIRPYVLFSYLKTFPLNLRIKLHVTSILKTAYNAHHRIVPEELLNEYKNKLTADNTPPLDNFIQRHSRRKLRNLLNLDLALKELKVLIQEGLIDSQSPRDIVDFCFNISKMPKTPGGYGKQIISLLSNLPSAELKWLFTLEKYFLRTEDTNFTGSPIKVYGAFMRRRNFNLTASEKSFVFESQGSIRKNPSLVGRSSVTNFPRYNPDFYLKQYPELPSYEYASSLFMRLLGITRLPYQDLVIVDSKYPVLLTQAVEGDPVFQVWHNADAFNNLDPFHTGLLIIAAILINPEDGKEDNFILSPDKRYLIPIDNDHCFLPSTFQKEGSFWNAWTVNTSLQTKTLLFCLDEMEKPIPYKVRNHILSLDFNLLLTSWMEELITTEERYHNLVNEEQRNAFIKNGTILIMPFYKQFIHHLYWKVSRIRDLLKSSSMETPLNLLKAVEPFAARCYQESFQPGSTLQSRFKTATNKLFNKSKVSVDGPRTSIQNTQSMMQIINISEKELRSDISFQKMGPPQVLEVLKRLIQERSQKRKTEKDLLWEFDDSKQEKRFLSLFGSSQVETSLKDFFANPKEGLLLKKAQSTTITKLTDLLIQSFDIGTKIRFLSLPNSPSLSEREIRIMATECPYIEYLNVSGCNKLNEIVTAKKQWLLLARLEARECPNLKRLTSYSPMKVLRIGTENKIQIFVENFTLDIFMISAKADEFEFAFKKGEDFQIKYLNQILSTRGFLINFLNYKEKFDQYFINFEMTIGKQSILSAKDLAMFITSIHLKNLNIKAQGIQRMTTLNLKSIQSLDLSNNKLWTSESLEHLVHAGCIELKHLNLASNAIKDHDLITLSRGNWPQLETLHLDFTQATKRGILNFLLKTNWLSTKGVKISFYSNDYFNDLLPNILHLLEKLDLSFSKVTHDEIEAIIEKDHLPQLKQSYLHMKAEINDKTLRILAQMKWPRLEIPNLQGKELIMIGLQSFILKKNFIPPKTLISGRSPLLNKLLPNNCALLEELDLTTCEIPENELKILVEKFNLPKLRSLWLSWKDLKYQAVPILCQGNWPFLENLSLTRCKLTPYEILQLISSSNWPQLKCLDLSTNPEIFNEGLQVIVEGNWPLLEILNLNETGVTEKGLLEFVSETNWLNLKQISLSSSIDRLISDLLPKNRDSLQYLKLFSRETTLTHFKGIFEQCSFPQLKHLSISGHKICDEGLQVLAKGNWPQLETLNLNYARVSKKGVLNLLLNKNWPNLRKIIFYFDENDLTNWAEKNNWLSLEHLDLSKGEITESEVSTVVKESDWPQLKHLNLSDNNISDKGLQTLAQGNWSLIETLKLDCAGITKKGLFDFIFQAVYSHTKEFTISPSWGETNANLDILWRQNNFSLIERFEIQNRKTGLAETEANNQRISQCVSNFNEGAALAFAGAEYLSYEESFSQEGPTEIDGVFLQSNWFQLKHLDISNNEIFDKGLSALALVQWPLLEELHVRNTRITDQGIGILVNRIVAGHLKKLDISENTISDKGLKMLASGKWPLLQHLAYNDTKATFKGSITLLKNSRWQNFRQLEHSICDSFSSKEGNIYLDETSLPENLMMIAQIHHEKQSFLAIILDNIWQNSEEIFISIKCTTLIGKIIIFSHNRWNQLDSVKLSVNVSPKVESIQSTVCPSHLKIFDASNNSLSDERKLKSLSLWNCSLLEELDLQKTSITSQGLKNVINKLDWPYLRKLNVSYNSINIEGLKLLSSGKWPLLEYLNLRSTKATAEGIQIIIQESDWPKLRKLDVSDNLIGNEGLKFLSSGKWPQLEQLYLLRTSITLEGVEIMASLSEWPNLKVLNLAWNKNIFDERFGALASVKWSLLECLYLNETEMTVDDIENLINKSSWPVLKEIHFTGYHEKQTIASFVLRKWPNINLMIS